MLSASSICSTLLGSVQAKVAAALVAGVLIAGCGGSDSPAPAPTPAAGDVVSIADTTVTGASFASKTELITYRMPGVDGSLVEATAVVMIPTGTTPTGGWDVLGWGHATTGVADKCAPSADPTLGGADVYLDQLLNANFAIVAPDYEGLGTAGGHPYLNLDSEGRSLLYAIDAAVRQYPELSNRYGLVGHSQGGHAVLGAAELANQNETPNIQLVGTVAIAPESQVEAQGDSLVSLVENPLVPTPDRQNAGIAYLSFGALILAGVEATNPAFDFASVLTNDGAFIETVTQSECLGTIRSEIGVPVQTAITNDGNLNSLINANARDEPQVAAYLTALEPGTRSIAQPVKLIQGTADTTVPLTSTQTLETVMSNAGSADVVLVPFAGEDHVSILLASISEVITTLAGNFNTAP